MKIEKIETFIAVNWMMVRVTTDNGIQGVGESTFFGWPGAAENVVLSFEPYLIGKDPLRNEHHWNYMYRAKSMRGGAIGGGISAIDQALWDIKGKYFEAPVWQLLGGKARDAVRAMLVLPTGTLEEVAQAAADAKADGFTAVNVCSTSTITPPCDTAKESKTSSIAWRQSETRSVGIWTSESKSIAT